MKIVVASMAIGLLASCSDRKDVGAIAQLTVAFDGEAPKQLDVAPTYSNTSAAMMIRVNQQEITALITIPYPIIEGNFAIGSTHSAWAKTVASSPVLATQGNIEVVSSADGVSISIIGASAAETTLTPAMKMSGSISGLRQ